MKFGKKRSSPEPEPVDITHRLSILDLRTSARASAPVAMPATATPVEAPAPPAAVAPPAIVTPPPVVVAPHVVEAPPVVVAPPVVEAPPVVVAPPAAVEQPADALAMPDAAAYEMAAFELSPPPVPAAPPEPVEEPVEEPVAESVPEPTPEPTAEPVAEVLAPAWSYEQVARIEDAEHHVTAWVQPAPVGQPLEPQPELHPVAAWEQPSPEELATPVVETVAPAEPAAVAVQSTGWGVPAEPVAAPQPDHHPVAEWETPDVAATAEVPGPRADEAPASVDLAEPAAATAPEIDLTEPIEHDPVYAAVEAAARQERPQDDEGVVRWRW